MRIAVAAPEPEWPFCRTASPRVTRPETPLETTLERIDRRHDPEPALDGRFHLVVSRT